MILDIDLGYCGWDWLCRPRYIGHLDFCCVDHFEKVDYANHRNQQFPIRNILTRFYRQCVLKLKEKN